MDKIETMEQESHTYRRPRGRHCLPGGIYVFADAGCSRLKQKNTSSMSYVDKEQLIHQLTIYLLNNIETGIAE